jgi:hypothetical protein
MPRTKRTQLLGGCRNAIFLYGESKCSLSPPYVYIPVHVHALAHKIDRGHTTGMTNLKHLSITSPPIASTENPRFNTSSRQLDTHPLVHPNRIQM